jgi:SH3-like domain-containing protein
MSQKSFFILLIALLLFPFQTFGADENGLTGTGLPLPRFASLRVSEANMRTGPGTRYPIEWVLRHENTPLEIIAEYDVWRRVRDWEGAEGWIHKSALSGHRSLIVTGDVPHKLWEDAQSSTKVIAMVDPGSFPKAPFGAYIRERR